VAVALLVTGEAEVEGPFHGGRYYVEGVISGGAGQKRGQRQSVDEGMAERRERGRGIVFLSRRARMRIERMEGD
jgi:hypothetical protein